MVKMEWNVIYSVFFGSAVSSLIFIGGFYIYIKFDSSGTIREWFSEGPLGLRRIIGRTKSHAISEIRHASFESWAKGLSRSSRCTMLKQVPKIIERENICIKSISPQNLSWRHLSVILSHECKHMPITKAVFSSIMRFLVASSMCGKIDEFWIDDKLLGWSQSIIKGRTYRAMWFYQRKQYSKLFLWYKTIDIAITRVINIPNVDFIDLGPSANDGVITTKEKLGFRSELDWVNICDYKGDFCRPFSSNVQQSISNQKYYLW